MNGNQSSSGELIRRKSGLRRRDRSKHRGPQGIGLQLIAAIGLSGLVVATAVVVLASSVAAQVLLNGDLVNSISGNLPSVVGAVESDVFESVLIYDRHGRLLHEFWDPYGGRRTVVPLEDMPPHLIAATLATEDASFYDNPGFDARSILRAFWQNLQGQTIVSGASTITQQLVRNSLFEPWERTEQSYERKIREALLAYELSQRYSKDEILERYLNEIFYGNLAYGVEAAAQTYFNKSVGELTIAEAALLAGLPQAPSAHNPLVNPTAAKRRQREVLGLMVRHGYLTPEAAALAEREELQFQPPQMEIRAPHFVMYVRDILEKRYGLHDMYYRGLRVHTTIDLDLMEIAERVSRERLAQLAEYDADNAALVALDPHTGEILAMMGSVDFWSDSISGQVNMAIAARQPGSALKPFTYATAFALGLASPATIIVDEPTSFPGGPSGEPYRPRNHDNRFRGPVTVRKALGNSLNIPAVKMLREIGIRALVDTVHRMGITGLDDPDEYGLSLTLGGGAVRLLDLTFAYIPFARGGVLSGLPVPEEERSPGQRDLEPTAILRVVDSRGNVLEEAKPIGKRVLSPEVSWLITDILADNQARSETFGLDSALKLSRPAAAKTGTTDNYEDTWSIGYTPDLVVGVWVGNASNRPTRGLLSSRGAAAIWNAFMEDALEGRPTREFVRPPGIISATVDAATGLRPAPDAPTITDWFIEQTIPSQWAQPAVLPTPTPAEPTPTPAPAPTPLPTPVMLPDGRIAVPDLVGLPEEEARRIIDYLGLSHTYVNYQVAEDVDNRELFESIQPGHVLSHIPRAGEHVERGTTVHMAVRKP